MTLQAVGSQSYESMKEVCKEMYIDQRVVNIPRIAKVKGVPRELISDWIKRENWAGQRAEHYVEVAVIELRRIESEIGDIDKIAFALWKACLTAAGRVQDALKLNQSAPNLRILATALIALMELEEKLQRRLKLENVDRAAGKTAGRPLIQERRSKPVSGG